MRVLLCALAICATCAFFYLKDGQIPLDSSLFRASGVETRRNSGHAQAGFTKPAPEAEHVQAQTRQLKQGERIITGTAATLMEDHFDEGKHFMHTIVTTDDGEELVVDTPHGQRYIGEHISWIIQSETRQDALARADPSQQTFADRCGCLKTRVPIFCARCRQTLRVCSQVFFRCSYV